MARSRRTREPVRVRGLRGDRIRRIDTAERITTYVSEIAVPQGLAFAADGSLYVAQGVMYRVLRVPPGGGSYVPVAGTGSPGTSGDAGPALSAQLSDPAAIVARPDGLVLFSDIGGGVTWIRRLEAANIFPRAVVNAASFEHAFLSAGELVTIFYTDLPAPENGAVSVRVLFDGVAAPVLFAGPGQINTRIPESLAGRSATALQISVNGRSSNTVGPSLQPTHPGIFAGFINEDGTLNSAANPARRDSIVSLYGTGAGALASTAMLPVEVGIGGVAAEVLYAGPQQVAGVFQINVRIPGAVEVAGAVPVRLVLNGITVDAPAPLAVEPGGAK